MRNSSPSSESAWSGPTRRTKYRNIVVACRSNSSANDDGEVIDDAITSASVRGSITTCFPHVAPSSGQIGGPPTMAPMSARDLGRRKTRTNSRCLPEKNVVLLERKNAVIYGGGGTIGGAVARAFAREGATVHLAGRTPATLDQVAVEIREHGGTATTAQVDALDTGAVDAHADELVRDHGTLDVSMNLISTGDVQGTPLVEME